jgi:hypothetical protein
MSSEEYPISRQKCDVSIVISAPHSSPALTSLFTTFPPLQVAQEEFLLLLSIITADLQEKGEDMKAARANKECLPRERRLASLQLFMLAKYRARIQLFMTRSEASVEVLASLLSLGHRVQERLERHLAVLARMKRKIKSMLDMSEKYSVENIFLNLGVLSELSLELGEEGGRSRLRSSSSCSDWSDSLQSQESEGQEGGSGRGREGPEGGPAPCPAPSPASRPAASPAPSRGSRRRLRSFHCLSDSLTVLRGCLNISFS